MGGRIDPMERAIFVGYGPDAIFTGRDATLWACWWNRESGTDRVLGRVDANKFGLPTQRNPNAAETISQTRANFAGHTYRCNDPVRCRINSLHGIGFRARYPDIIIGDQNPVCGSANLDCCGW